MDDFTTAALIFVIPMFIMILICIPAGLKVTVHFPDRHYEDKNSDTESDSEHEYFDNKEDDDSDHDSDSDDECDTPPTEPPPINRALDFDDAEDGKWDVTPMRALYDVLEPRPLSSETL
jgi:hypothetical protein